MSFWAINGWLPTYLKEHFNLNLGKAGISATSFIQVASFIGVIVGGVIADRWSRRNIRGFHDSNRMPVICQVIDNRYRVTGYVFLNFFNTIVGGIMVYIGGALKDANISLSVVFQFSAAGLLIACWSLLLMRPQKEP